jgi:DNA polymerase elongation subunit (family B)
LFTIFNTESLAKLRALKADPNSDPELVKSTAIQCRAEAFEMGKIAGQQATKALFKYPNSLEFEKVYDPIFLLSKKRYIGAYFSKSTVTMDFIESKGVVTKRRDTFPLLKEAYTTGIDLLVHKERQGLAEYKIYLKDLVNSIHTGSAATLDLQKFIITKKLNAEYKSKTLDNNKGPFKVTRVSKDRLELTIKFPSSVNISGINQDVIITYENPNTQSFTIKTEKVLLQEETNEIVAKLTTPVPESFQAGKTSRSCPNVRLSNTLCPTNIPHVVLSEKIGKRDPGNKPRSNDRIPYIFVKKDHLKKTSPVFKKVEDPVYAAKHNLKIDPQYYIDHLKTPICELLGHFLDDPEKLFSV